MTTYTPLDPSFLGYYTTAAPGPPASLFCNPGSVGVIDTAGFGCCPSTSTNCVVATACSGASAKVLEGGGIQTCAPGLRCVQDKWLRNPSATQTLRGALCMPSESSAVTLYYTLPITIKASTTSPGAAKSTTQTSNSRSPTGSTSAAQTESPTAPSPTSDTSAPPASSVAPAQSTSSRAAGEKMAPVSGLLMAVLALLGLAM